MGFQSGEIGLPEAAIALNPNRNIAELFRLHGVEPHPALLGGADKVGLKKHPKVF